MKKIVLGLTFVLVFISCGRSPEPEATPNLKKIRIALNWFPEVEHGGYYEAQRRGFYREAGFDVELLPGGPGAGVVQRVAGGEVDFGVENADKVIFGRAQGANVAAHFAPIQTSPHCVMVHKSSGFGSLADLKNVTLALAPNVAFAAWLKKKLPLENVTIVPYPGNIARFLTDSHYAQQGYAFAEPLHAEREGSDPQIFLIAETGFNPYSSVLIAADNTDSDVIARLASASKRGWEEYLKSPSETNRLLNSINREMSVETLEEGTRRMVPMTAGQGDFGSMTLERWQTLVDQMVEVGLVAAGAVDPSETFRNH